MLTHHRALPFRWKLQIHRWSDPLIGGLLLLTWLKIAWAADDAYVYFRSVEMWYAGYGPVYNPGWRVQAYTSPLWYGLLVLGRAFFSDVYLVAQIWSFFLSAWVWWRVRRWASTPALRWLTALAWGTSIGFFDYTSSGLETPLVYALLMALLEAWEEKRSWLGLALFSWLALARYDVALFLAGPTAAILGWDLLQSRSRGIPWKQFLLALAPLALWGIVALVYYGTPLPNPVYAKVFTGLPRTQVLRQGLLYYVAHLQMDTWTLLVVLFGGVLWWFLPRGRPWAIGIGLYLVYIVWVGGDFMLGRFLAPAFLVAWVAWLQRGWKTASRAWWAAAALAWYNVFVPHTPLKSPLFHQVPWQFIHGVIDERGRYHQASSLLSYALYHWQGRPYPFFPVYGWSQQGYTLRGSPLRVAVVDSVGMFGFWAGFDTTVIDVWALTDPFLARLPDADGEIWRPGHAERDIPSGYLLTLLSGENHLQDADLQRLWRQVVLVTQGPLFSLERWQALPGYALGRWSP